MKKHFLILAFLMLSNVVFAQYREIKQLRNSFPSIKDDKLRINVLNKLGFLYFFRDVDSCYYYADKAKALAIEIGYQKGIADAYKVYGIRIMGENNYLAAKYYSNALDIYRQIHDKESECGALINISNLLYADNDTTKGYKYASLAYKISQSLGKDSVKAGIIVNLVHNRDPNSKTNSPMYKLLLQGLSISEKYHDERVIMGNLMSQGIYIWKSGKHQEAIEFAKNNIIKADAFGNVFAKVEFYAELGEWLEVIDPPASSLYYKQALGFAITYKYNLLAAWISGQLYTHYKSINQTDTALIYASQVIDANQKIQADLKKSGVDALMYIQKDGDLKLSQEKQRATAKILIVLTLLLLAVIALSFFIYRSFLIKKRYAITENALRKSTETRNKELELWNNFNNMLIAVLAHDLRQPFSSIIMTATIMELPNKELDEEEFKLIMGDLKDNAYKSIELLEGLLCWVKSKKESFEYKTQPLMLNDLILESNGLYEYDQQKKNITLSNNVPEKQVVYAQKQMLLFINRNLISNATKYSPKNSVITVSSSIVNNELIVTFEDSGSGMTNEQIKNLFLVGEKIKLDGTAVKGAGIALTICYDMILQMNGRLWVESEVKKFTKFHYALPVKN